MKLKLVEDVAVDCFRVCTLARLLQIAVAQHPRRHLALRQRLFARLQPVSLLAHRLVAAV